MTATHMVISQQHQTLWPIGHLITEICASNDPTLLMDNAVFKDAAGSKQTLYFNDVKSL